MADDNKNTPSIIVSKDTLFLVKKFLDQEWSIVKSSRTKGGGYTIVHKISSDSKLLISKVGAKPYFLLKFCVEHCYEISHNLCSSHIKYPAKIANSDSSSFDNQLYTAVDRLYTSLGTKEKAEASKKIKDAFDSATKPETKTDLVDVILELLTESQISDWFIYHNRKQVNGHPSIYCDLEKKNVKIIISPVPQSDYTVELYNLLTGEQETEYKVKDTQGEATPDALLYFRISALYYETLQFRKSADNNKSDKPAVENNALMSNLLYNMLQEVQGNKERVPLDSLQCSKTTTQDIVALLTLLLDSKSSIDWNEFYPDPLDRFRTDGSSICYTSKENLYTSLVVSSFPYRFRVFLQAYLNGTVSRSAAVEIHWFRESENKLYERISELFDSVLSEKHIGWWSRQKNESPSAIIAADPLIQYLTPYWEKAEEQFPHLVNREYDLFINDILDLYLENISSVHVSLEPYHMDRVIFAFTEHDISFCVDHPLSPLYFLNATYTMIRQQGQLTSSLFREAPYIASTETKQRFLSIFIEQYKDSHGLMFRYDASHDALYLDNSKRYCEKRETRKSLIRSIRKSLSN